MAEVDLIPADYAKGRVVRARARQLLAGCIAVAVVAGSARLALGAAMAFEKIGIARLQKDGEVSARSKAAADAYRQQKLMAEKQLAELDDLRGGDRLKLLLHAIDASHAEGIWLDEMRFLRHDRAPGTTAPLAAGGRSEIIVVPKPPATGAAPASEGSAHRVELVGHAVNHTRLAEFMRKLGAQPGIAEVRLQDSALGALRGVPVVDLTLTLLLDDKPGKRR